MSAVFWTTLAMNQGGCRCWSSFWNSYGSEVTIVEMLPALVPNEDAEVSKELAKAFKKVGINALTGHKVEKIDAAGDNIQVTVSSEKGEQTIITDQVLVAIGFAPNAGGFGLDVAGVNTGEHGFIEIDGGMRTNVSGIYAIGDVTGKLMLAHVGMAMGIACAETIGAQDGKCPVPRPLNYVMMPRATYSAPQVASFGYTESQAQEQGYQIEVARFNFQANGKALGLGDYAGWIKIVSDAEYGEILGAHMIGPEVTELLPELTLAHNEELTADEIAHNVHAHPSLSEVLAEAAHGLTEGGYIHQ